MDPKVEKKSSEIEDDALSSRETNVGKRQALEVTEEAREKEWRQPSFGAKLFLGDFAMKIPTEYGGLGFSQTNYNRAVMKVASYCGATAVLISAHQSIGVPQPLLMYGTEEQKKKFLPRFRTGDISAFALTEVDVG